MKVITKQEIEAIWKDNPKDKLYLLNTWLIFSYPAIIGSAIFTNNKSLTSKLVCEVQKKKCPDKDYIPSHVGSIIKHKGTLYCFDMKPPRAKVTLLAEYLLTTKDDYVIITRDFILDLKIWNENFINKIGSWYPYISAISSAFHKWKTPKLNHCSELHLRELQKQGLFMGVNPEITPDELYHVMLAGSEVFK